MNWRLVAVMSVLPLLAACESVDGSGARLASGGVQVQMTKVSETGIGASIGVLVLADTPGGLAIEASLAGLPPGPRGFHVHEKGDCGPALKDGKPVAALAAGAHYDVGATGRHEGPHGQGHAGDLPVLVVDAAGNAASVVVAPRLKLDDVRGRAIMIHEGGDNFSDQPKPLGGGGARIACGVVPVRAN